MADKGELLVRHYQSSFELTYKLWAQRNRTFLLLIAVIAGATVLTYRPADTQPLLVAWVANALGLEDEAARTALALSFPYALLQGVLLSVVFYLMFNLSHRALYILRSYAYLGTLEAEIRAELAIGPDELAFTRESSFYWKDRPALLGTVKYVYVLVLGTLLGAFLLGRVWNDFQSGSGWLLAADIALSVPIGLYFVGYALYTVRFDAADVLRRRPKN